MRGRAVARGRPIVVEWAAEVRDFLRGTRQVEKSVDEVADELQDAAKDADRFEDRFTESMRDAERQADRSARNMGRDFGRLEGDMADVGKEGASELRQNLAEGLSSGNIEDVVQDTLGGLVSGLDGVVGGVVATLAGVAAFAFNAAREEAEAQVQALEDLAQSVIDRMLELQSSILTSKDAADLLAEAVQQNPEHWQKVADLAAEAGVNWTDVATKVIEGGGSAQDVYQELYDIIAEGTETGARGVQNRTDEANAARELLGILRDTEGEVQDVAKEYALVEEALRNTAGYSNEVKENLRRAEDFARGLRGELPYRGGNQAV